MGKAVHQALGLQKLSDVAWPCLQQEHQSASLDLHVGLVDQHPG